MVKMSESETVKIELELPNHTATALTKIATHFTMTPNRLATYFLDWQLAVETDQFFKNLIEDKVESFLLENCLDHETIQHMKTEIYDILSELQ